jgi:RNA polymerase sigma-70 factor (ECF subfamily)
MAERARDGDRSAFESLVRATSADTYALALRLTGDEHDARDVVQEAYLRAFRSIGSFRGDSAFSTWLFRITANCSASHFRRRRGLRRECVNLEAIPSDLLADHGSDGRDVDVVERDWLVRALRLLPPALRSVVVLRDVYDLSHEAIAAELGISGAATRVRLHRARKLLKTALYPEPNPGGVGEADGSADPAPGVGPGIRSITTARGGTVPPAADEERSCAV